MTPGEIHEAKRANFIEKTQEYFEFLVSEFGFEGPKFLDLDYAYSFEFRQGSKKKLVIRNDYHGVDYGFEIDLFDLESGREELLYSVLKENQDVEQNYLKAASEFLRNWMSRTDYWK